MIEAAKNWLAQHLEFLTGQGLVIDMSGPTEQQTKKSVVISVRTERFSAVIYCFDSGECEADIADLASSPDTDFEDAMESNSHFSRTSGELETIFNGVFSKLLSK